MKDFLRNHQSPEDEEFTPIKEIYKNYDPKHLESLISNHQQLVHHVVNSYRHSGLPKDNLFAEGVLGLLTASKKFDLSHKVKFSTYAYYWIKARITRFIDFVKRRKVISLPHSQKKTNLHYSADDYFDNLSDHSEVEYEPGQSTRCYERSISIAISLLNDRMRLVARERILSSEPKTLEELGKILGMSREGVRQIEIRTLEEIKHNLQTIGFSMTGYLQLSIIANYIFSYLNLQSSQK